MISGCIVTVVISCVLSIQVHAASLRANQNSNVQNFVHRSNRGSALKALPTYDSYLHPPRSRAVFPPTTLFSRRSRLGQHRHEYPSQFTPTSVNTQDGVTPPKASSYSQYLNEEGLLVESPERQRAVSLERIRKDMAAASKKAGLSITETGLLGTSIGLSALAPLVVAEKFIGIVVPSLGVLAAGVAFSAEYNGKIGTAKAKEIAAQSMIVFAEADVYMNRSERAKSIIALCIAIALASFLWSLACGPAWLPHDPAWHRWGIPDWVIQQTYLATPLIAGFAAGVADLAATDASSLASTAMGVGIRRFATSDDVVSTWTSTTQRVVESNRRTRTKWLKFILHLVPAPFIAALCPGDLGWKAIVAAGFGCIQAHYSLSRAEKSIAAATGAVALKKKAAATTDYFANRSAKSSSLLPFTSILSGICAATTVFAVEFGSELTSVLGQCLSCATFPALGAMLAAAASISKDGAELDSKATQAAADTVAQTRIGSTGFSPYKQTFREIREVIGETVDKTGRLIFGR
eukprot:gnl/MRDRNA2_/MRDRNA2_33575_c0_seq1.p1 gnl/MRDRNA2_/MRDRNA2_33575_c0~~gnl/MRDRNA2_/MRDRNA2_33575_c0_seq1.p1  ORF type:complete len:520 (-),score=99.53 gnl/MRDRNA2_/MRDRNA2_33575_c0_seq1:127-1686(-)